MQRKTLVICGHPDLKISRVNSVILDKLSLFDVTVHNLSENHDAYNFDVKREQNLLLEHNRVVFLFPLYWYSTPALLKKWFDDVLVPGFAYARGGDKLLNKEFMVVTTVGAMEEGYRAGGFNNYTIDELLRPIQQLTYYVKAKYIPPYSIYESVFISEEYLKEESEKVCQFIISEYQDPTFKYEQMLLKAEEMQIELIN